MARASVKLAGVAMAGNNVSWAITSGAASPQQAFAVHEELDNILQSINGKRPIDLVMEGTFVAGSGSPVPSSATMGGLYLRRREGILDGRKPVWVISDVRSWWESLWISCVFSARRQTNEFRYYGVGRARDFNRTAVLSYIPLTMIAGASPDTDPDFASGADVPESCKRWTAKKALLWCLKGYFRTDPSGVACEVKPKVFDLSGADNGRPLSDWRAHGRWPDVVNALARLAHVGITTNRSGGIVLYSLAPTDFTGLGGTIRAGTPQIHDLSRSRAERLRVLARAEREARLNFIEDDTGATSTTTTVERNARRPISLTLENVLILPNDVRDEAAGQLIPRGTIVPLTEALRLWNQDPDNPPPFEFNQDGQPTNARIRFSLEFLRRWIHTSALAVQMTNTGRLTQVPDQIFAARASALYSSYRRVFRFPSTWLDMIESARLERVAVQDAVFGKRNPSPVYSDHFIEYNIRGMIARAQGGRVASLTTTLAGNPQDVWAAGDNFYAWDGALRTARNFDLLPLREGNLAPQFLSWVNQRQLVFKIEDFPDLAAQTARIIQGTFSTIPLSRTGGYNATWEADQTELEAPWRFSTIVSVVLRTPNNTRRFYSRTYTKNTTPALPSDATGPAVDIFTGAMTAGYEWLDPGDPGGTPSRVVDGPDGVEITGGRLCNPQTMKDVSDATASDVIFRQANRTLGVFERLRPVDSLDTPRGEITTVEISYSSGRIVSRHYADGPPVPPAILDKLSPSVRDAIFRLEQVPPP